MTQPTSLESYNASRYALRTWDPTDDGDNRLKQQLLDFLDIAETEKDRLVDRCETNIAEQQQIELALCHTEDAISITATKGDIRLVNPAFEKLTGYNGSEVIGTNHKRFWDRTDKRIFESMEQVTAKGMDWRGELVLVAKSGKQYDVQASVVPIVLPTGKVTHYVFTLHNITDRIRLEKSLTQQKQFLEKVINLNPGIIIVLDEDGEWILDNLAAKTLLSDMGPGARESLSKTLLAELHRDHAVKSRKLTLTMPNDRRETFIIFSEEIPVKYLLPDAADKMAHLMTLSNITQLERKNHEILVRQKALLALRLEKNLIQGEFTNGFIYQLQKPLNIAEAAISTMKTAIQQNNTDKISQTLPLVEKELEFLKNEIVKFRAMNQDVPDTTASTTSHELSEATQILYQEPFEAGAIDLVGKADSGVTFPMPYEIMQLLLKILIDNALEACEAEDEKPFVRVRFSSERSGSLLTVEDSGPGIPKKDRYRAFEPFFSTKQNRSGLSLTILHQLLNNIHGNVDLNESSLGGARLSLFFPTGSL